MLKRYFCILLCGILTVCCVLSAYGAEGAGEPEEFPKEDYPFDLVVDKVDSITRLPVTGAEFVLTGEDGSYLQLDDRGKCYAWTENQGEATPLITDSQGRFRIQNLTPGVYYLTETAAPESYNLLKAPLKLAITALFRNNENEEEEISKLMIQVDDEDVIYSTDPGKDRLVITVENVYATLPMSGGMGSSMYYIFGVIALFIAVLIYVAKRLSDEKEKS